MAENVRGGEGTTAAAHAGDGVGVGVGVLEKSGKKSGPCLIAGFRAVNSTSPSYWNPIVLDSSGTASVDMVRLKITLMGDGRRWISERAETWQCDDFAGWVSKIRPGAWYELLSFGLGDSSLAMGLGQFEKSCALNERRAFMEFNPNKVAGDKRFWDLLGRVSKWVSHAELIRFDFAYDVPRPRSECMLSKDRRMYKAVVSDGVTEYLGVKNTPGYVKVYDKAKERGLEGDLTRIELTCDGEWTSEQVRQHWPQVHGWSSDGADNAGEKSRAWLRVVGMMAADLAARGAAVEPYVQQLARYSREKVREYLRTSFVDLPQGVPEAIVSEAREWCDLSRWHP